MKKMKTKRARYTLEYKQEAVRLVESGQSIAAAARSLGMVDQTLFNWVKAAREGKLKGADTRSCAFRPSTMPCSRMASSFSIIGWFSMRSVPPWSN
jgi:transposase-like protein